jgi:hypothetical protein
VVGYQDIGFFRKIFDGTRGRRERVPAEVRAGRRVYERGTALRRVSRPLRGRARHILCRTKAQVPFVAFVTAVGTDEQCVMEDGLHQAFSPRPVNGPAAAFRAVSGMSSIEYELHNAPFQPEQSYSTAVRKGLGFDQPAVYPWWEPQSYS